MIEEKISKYSGKIAAREVYSVFEDSCAKSELNKLHNDFVVVPIDKASSNVSFICKRNYADVIPKELKFSLRRNNPSSGNTYENIVTPTNEILQSHADMIKNGVFHWKRK